MEKSKIIAVDFDGTLCTNNWPDIGEPNKNLIGFLRLCKEEGCTLILWTCRVDAKLDEAILWCNDHGLYFDFVNRNTDELIAAFGEDTRKIFADIYIDDRAWNPYVKSLKDMIP